MAGVTSAACFIGSVARQAFSIACFQGLQGFIFFFRPRAPGPLPFFVLAFALQLRRLPALPEGCAAVGGRGGGDAVAGIARQCLRGGVAEAVAPASLGDGVRGAHGLQKGVSG